MHWQRILKKHGLVKLELCSRSWSNLPQSLVIYDPFFFAIATSRRSPKLPGIQSAVCFTYEHGHWKIFLLDCWTTFVSTSKITLLFVAGWFNLCLAIVLVACTLMIVAQVVVVLFLEVIELSACEAEAVSFSWAFNGTTFFFLPKGFCLTEPYQQTNTRQLNLVLNLWYVLTSITLQDWIQQSNYSKLSKFSFNLIPWISAWIFFQTFSNQVDNFTFLPSNHLPMWVWMLKDC